MGLTVSQPSTADILTEPQSSEGQLWERQGEREVEGAGEEEREKGREREREREREEGRHMPRCRAVATSVVEICC